MNLFTKQKQTHRLNQGKGGERNSQSGIDMYMLLYLKWINNKDLLYNTGNSAQYFVIT